MVIKIHHSFIISLLLILFLNASAGSAAYSTQNSSDQSNLWEMKTHTAGSGMVEIYGEVEAISATEVLVNTGTREYQLPLGSRTKIFCNGLPALWLALRPVTSEAFFEAKVQINPQNEVVSITGVYWGEICVLNCWRWEQDKLYLKLAAPDSGRTYWRMVSPRAKIPKINWLAEDVEIYVLYNYQQNIRAVFLPE
jgi:hypothetical protein